MSTIWLFSFCSLDWDSLEIEKTLLGLYPHSFAAAAYVNKTAVKSYTGIFFFSQNNYCKTRMLEGERKDAGNKNSSFRFLSPSFRL